MSQGWLPGMEAEQRRLDLSQWYTPEDLAQHLWAWTRKNLGVQPLPWYPTRVLEPAAGRGSLIAPITGCTVKAYDADPGNVEHLRSKGIDAECKDFLAVAPKERFTVVLQNPPYEDDQDVDFIVHALDFAPVTTGIFRAALLNTQGRFESLWKWHDPTRIVFLRGRPKFGGDGSPKSDFNVFEIRRRSSPREPGEQFSPSSIEWW